MLDRLTVDTLATSEDISEMNFSDAALSHKAVMLLGFQRTKHISRKSRLSWMDGDPGPLNAEAAARRRNIFDGALLDIYQEYLPLRDHLRAYQIRPNTIVDIGCGQALNDLFLHRDYNPHFTLVDIEETPNQYHSWANEGSGYASLASATAMLRDNGVDDVNTVAINPRKEPERLNNLKADLVTSLYSCGFHYPIDEYVPLFLRTLENGGAVCLDLRNNYVKNYPDSAGQLLDAGEVTVLYEEMKAKRIIVRK